MSKIINHSLNHPLVWLYFVARWDVTVTRLVATVSPWRASMSKMFVMVWYGALRWCGASVRLVCQGTHAHTTRSFLLNEGSLMGVCNDQVKRSTWLCHETLILVAMGQ